MYTTQVSSYEELKERMTKAQEVISKINSRIKINVEAMNKSKQVCDDDLQAKISEAKAKNEQIMRRLIQVFSKIQEHIMRQTGRGILKAEHEALNQ